MSLSKDETSRLIEMCWEDRTPFEAIMEKYNLSENEIKKIMKVNLKRNSYILWRERVQGRHTKLKKKNDLKFLRHQSSNHNKFR
tara:strand:+ start:10777 stop:11028 length:252 start_codon:yes stop_codon:yes gene_type:complete